jgi:hypothetical protein
MTKFEQIENEEKREEKIISQENNILKNIIKINKKNSKKQETHKELIPPIKWFRLLILAEIFLGIVTFYPTSTVFLNKVCLTFMIAILFAFIIKLIRHLKK